MSSSKSDYIPAGIASNRKPTSDTVPATEFQRLKIVRELRELISVNNWERLVHLISRIFQVPYVAISLMDSQVQWILASVIKSRICKSANEAIDYTGISLANNSSGTISKARSTSLCAHTIQDEAESLVLSADTLKDRRFATYTEVQGGSLCRFYAAVPLVVRGAKVGTICIHDYKPHDDEPQMLQKIRAMLPEFGAIVSEQLQNRLKQTSTQDAELARVQMGIAYSLKLPLEGCHEAHRTAVDAARELDDQNATIKARQATSAVAVSSSQPGTKQVEEGSNITLNISNNLEHHQNNLIQPQQQQQQVCSGMFDVISIIRLRGACDRSLQTILDFQQNVRLLIEATESSLCIMHRLVETKNNSRYTANSGTTTTTNTTTTNNNNNNSAPSGVLAALITPRCPHDQASKQKVFSLEVFVKKMTELLSSNPMTAGKISWQLSRRVGGERGSAETNTSINTSRSERLLNEKMHSAIQRVAQIEEAVRDHSEKWAGFSSGSFPSAAAGTSSTSTSRPDSDPRYDDEYSYSTTHTNILVLEYLMIVGAYRYAVRYHHICISLYFEPSDREDEHSSSSGGGCGGGGVGQVVRMQTESHTCSGHMVVRFECSNHIDIGQETTLCSNKPNDPGFLRNDGSGTSSNTNSTRSITTGASSTSVSRSSSSKSSGTKSTGSGPVRGVSATNCTATNGTVVSTNSTSAWNDKVSRRYYDPISDDIFEEVILGGLATVVSGLHCSISSSTHHPTKPTSEATAPLSLIAPCYDANTSSKNTSGSVIESRIFGATSTDRWRDKTGGGGGGGSCDRSNDDDGGMGEEVSYASAMEHSFGTISHYEGSGSNHSSTHSSTHEQQQAKEAEEEEEEEEVDARTEDGTASTTTGTTSTNTHSNNTAAAMRAIITNSSCSVVHTVRIAVPVIQLQNSKQPPTACTTSAGTTNYLPPIIRRDDTAARMRNPKSVSWNEPPQFDWQHQTRARLDELLAVHAKRKHQEAIGATSMSFPTTSCSTTATTSSRSGYGGAAATGWRRYFFFPKKKTASGGKVFPAPRIAHHRPASTTTVTTTTAAAAPAASISGTDHAAQAIDAPVTMRRPAAPVAPMVISYARNTTTSTTTSIHSGQRSSRSQRDSVAYIGGTGGSGRSDGVSSTDTRSSRGIGTGRAIVALLLPERVVSMFSHRRR